MFRWPMLCGLKLNIDSGQVADVRDRYGSLAAIDSFNVISVGIKNEGGVIARATLPRRAVVSSARSKRSAVERIYLGSCPRSEGGVLLDRMRMKMVDPEYWIIFAVPIPSVSAPSGICVTLARPRAPSAPS
jgi:hypothetical protein